MRAAFMYLYHTIFSGQIAGMRKGSDKSRLTESIKLFTMQLQSMNEIFFHPIDTLPRRGDNKSSSGRIIPVGTT